MEIIPAIDIIDGKCVRLTQGDYSQKTIYNENPLEVALEFESIGITRLHLVDLDGAKLGKVVNYKVLESIASKTKLSIDFGAFSIDRKLFYVAGQDFLWQIVDSQVNFLLFLRHRITIKSAWLRERI